MNLSNLRTSPTLSFQFSFHERDKQMFARKAEKIERVMEAEKKEREFRANPMPDLTRTVGLPSKEPAGPTQAKPFNLEVRDSPYLSYSYL